ncbi:MAG: calcium/sodium antiporter, partial [Candidatus Wallbacteria bacterium]|nr:calcium/sodium antiporter [Candidatus Wallbacteria bacterium]
MFLPLIMLVAGVVLLYYGADFLVRGAGRLALRFGLSPLFVGLTIVSMGTSLPEFFVSIIAAAENKPDIAISNVVGSNVTNIALVLGLCCLLKPMTVKRQVNNQLILLLFYSI